MNTLTTKFDDTPHAELIRVLRDSVWPGAKDASIEMAIAYCKVNSLDPFLKPVHIVPYWDKDTRSTRDVLMPGIADYRVKAARSGEYAGKSEPEFGEDVTRKFGSFEVIYPKWCRVTIERIVAGQPRSYVAKEFWTENYATAGRDTDAPNAMWRKRPYGQLAKCAEAQALRMAFPEFSGGMPTAEEMEGKSFDGVTIDADVPRPPKRSDFKPKAEAKTIDADSPSEASKPLDEGVLPTKKATAKTLDAVAKAMSEAESLATDEAWKASDDRTRAWREKLADSQPELSASVEDAYVKAALRVRSAQAPDDVGAGNEAVYPLSNSFGENDDGPFGPATDPIAFAVDFARVYAEATPDQRITLAEFNDESTAAAIKASQEAAGIIAKAFQQYPQKAEVKETASMAEVKAQANDAPQSLGPTDRLAEDTLDIPRTKTPKGGWDVVAWTNLAKVRIATLEHNGIEAFFDVNRSSIAALPATAATIFTNALDARRAQLLPITQPEDDEIPSFDGDEVAMPYDGPTPTPSEIVADMKRARAIPGDAEPEKETIVHPKDEWEKLYLSFEIQIRMTKTRDELREIANNAAMKVQLRRIKENRPDLADALNKQYATREQELKNGR
jgi:phage recombination protein Bet